MFCTPIVYNPNDNRVVTTEYNNGVLIKRGGENWQTVLMSIMQWVNTHSV
jgi:hypothetical protein